MLQKRWRRGEAKTGLYTPYFAVSRAVASGGKKKADGKGEPGARKQGGRANVTGTSHGRWWLGCWAGLTGWLIQSDAPGTSPVPSQPACEVPCLPPGALGGWRIGRARSGGKSGSAGVNEERRRWVLVRRPGRRDAKAAPTFGSRDGAVGLSAGTARRELMPRARAACTGTTRRTHRHGATPRAVPSCIAHPTRTERTVGVLARGARWHRVGEPGRGARARAWRCVGAYGRWRAREGR
jgi:hypothetical protein